MVSDQDGIGSLNSDFPLFIVNWSLLIGPCSGFALGADEKGQLKGDAVRSIFVEHQVSGILIDAGEQGNAIIVIAAVVGTTLLKDPC